MLQGRRRLVRGAGYAAIVGATAFPLADLAVQLLQPSADAGTEYLSQAVHGPYGAVVVTAFVLTGIGYLVLATALHAALARNIWRRAAAGLVGLAGLLLLLSAAVPADPDGGLGSPQGAAHILMVVVATSALALAPAVVYLAMAPDQRRPMLRLVAFAVPPVIAGCGLMLLALRYLSLGELEGTRGVWERVTIVSLSIWATVTGAWLVQRGSADPPPDGARGQA